MDHAKKSRVHITYDLETNNAKVKKELPFVVGVIGDFSGHNKETPKLIDREFLEINKDNFNSIMQNIAPQLHIAIDNLVDKKSGEKIHTELKFNSIDDFHPVKIANQIPALKKLLNARQKLLEIMAKAESSEIFESQIEKYFNQYL